MNWREWTYWQKGGIIGAIILVLLTFPTSVQIIDLQGIKEYTGGEFGNIIGWLFIYGFLFLIVSAVIIFMGFVAGALFGLVLGRIRGES